MLFPIKRRSLDLHIAPGFGYKGTIVTLPRSLRGQKRKEGIRMLLDCNSLGLLRLAGLYQCLPFPTANRSGLLAPLGREVELLHDLGYLNIARNHQYLSLTPPGFELLDRCNIPYVRAAKRPYAGSPSLRRRLKVGLAALTCLGAGIEPTCNETEALRHESTFLPAFTLRTKDFNLMNAACCLGFGHWGGTAYMLEYAGPDDRGFYLSNELGQFSGLSSIFTGRVDTPKALLLAGESYAAVYQAVTERTPSPRHSKQSYVDFWSVYDRLEFPVHLLACGDVGIKQLTIMRQSDYKSRLAQAAFGDRLNPTEAAFPEADGTVSGIPLVIAVDMDLRRVQKICAAAKAAGHGEVMVAALEEQMAGLLLSVLTRLGNVRALRIGDQVLRTAFGPQFSFGLPAPTAVASTDGGLLHV